jgi:hypothetical protein
MQQIVASFLLSPSTGESINPVNIVGEKHVAPLRVLGFVECQRQTLLTLTKYLPKNIENICNIKYIALELPYYIFSYDTMYVIGVMNIGNFLSYSLLNFAKF